MMRTSLLSVVAAAQQQAFYSLVQLKSETLLSRSDSTEDAKSVETPGDTWGTWGLNSDSLIYWINETGAGEWTQVDGGLVDISVGSDWVWGVNKDDIVYKCKNPCTGDWIKVAGSMMQIDVGDSQVWGVNRDGFIYWTPADGSGNWTHVPGKLKDISVGFDYVWGVNSDDLVYKCARPCTGDWINVPGELTQIDVGDDEVWGVNKDNLIYMLPSNGTGSWKQIQGKLKWVSVGRDVIWGVNSAELIYKCNRPCTGEFVQHPGLLKMADAAWALAVPTAAPTPIPTTSEPTPAPPPWTGDPTSSPTPEPTPCPDEGVCTIADDPHIKVFDGKQISLFQADIQGASDSDVGLGTYLHSLINDGEAGDVWLVKAEEVQIQARYVRDDGVSEAKLFVGALALGGNFVNGSAFIIRPLDSDCTYDGVPVLQDETSEFSVDGFFKATRGQHASLVQNMEVENPGVQVEFQNGIKVIVNRQHTYVNAAITMSPVLGQDGLCGNFNGDGDDDSLEMIEKRDPRVSQTESLFVPRQ